LGISIQYPSDWKLLEESNDKLRFIKQEGFVTADLNVEEIDQSDATLPEYAITRVNELRTQRPDFQLLSLEPILISNDKPAQKVVYTFEREEDGKTNKVMRIWSITEGKLYTLAYVAESSQYDRYLPSFQRMVDSFSIDNTTIQVQSNDREDNSGNGNCDPSYPTVCIKSPPPDLNCGDISYENFEVRGNDPHGFDRDNDGTGCESNGGPPPPPPPPCDRISYPDPDVCIPPYPPDLNCEDVPFKNFKVTGRDPHGFDRDNDGLGCESADGDGDDNNNDNGNKTKPIPIPIPNPCDKFPFIPNGNGRCIPICDETELLDGEVCRDEGDTTDPDPDPPTCTPDSLECPPCPEGVEAGWCADEDERGDFDCGDEGMENDPRCKDREPVNGSEEPEVVVEELPEEVDGQVEEG
jgi:hypothetical protein